MQHEKNSRAQEEDEPEATTGGRRQGLAGSIPSTREPANGKKEKVSIIRKGTDTLELTQRCLVNLDWLERLEHLKALAQSSIESDRAQAQLEFEEQILAVRGQGSGMYAYCLEDGFTRFSIAGANAKKIPAIYVQISSACLLNSGVVEATAILDRFSRQIATVEEEATISRVDFCVDFTTSHDLRVPIESWISRSQKINERTENGRFVGWDFGMGGVIVGRLYDKTFQAEKKKIEYLPFVWKAAGWNGDTVWRLEFQIRREPLREMEIVTVSDYLERQTALWAYLTKKWLRLTIPRNSKPDKKLWSTHPLWKTLSGITWDCGSQLPAIRLRSGRVPSDYALFVNGMGAITSFMAREGISDPKEGFDRYFQEAEQFHSEFSNGIGFHQYVDQKVALKGRRFNTILNSSEEGRPSHE
ncbi:MAG: hypothetical protein HQL69_17435 [Magnetococcales bacterium]|nr:hypothetical protein [Magnetococcales bacterium]